ncbi:MAG TPA: hypothetical protein DSN98_04385 [Thermoplasmata archaeon]|jgi:hypothetical protein|nr:MAG TPA: hypothetical protein DSN98_04385 [Thermoplasmata archaeon]
MNETDLKKTKTQTKCQKCASEIGGKSYYVIQLDCIYDGNSLSSCDRVVICSDCYRNLKSWLNLPQ